MVFTQVHACMHFHVFPVKCAEEIVQALLVCSLQDSCEESVATILKLNGTACSNHKHLNTVTYGAMHWY